MTIAELRILLDALSRTMDDYPVWLDGCDCSDEAAALHIAGGTLTIVRKDNIDGWYAEAGEVDSR